ncbi:MAG: ribose 5-phosphate isomerase A [Candidatus Diapherotrites archaeon CG10_big_fil_rev_8_21_14_0_10_31_34]|nr:MAG: ribose 5-phosphate isomerase A [Candidatus Diapherotrites archaeon CG10_big_fil_rev_8_21_14_0_10_31_34]
MKEKQKENSAIEALKYVKKGMTLGLGSGSTAEIFVKKLAEKNKKEKLDLTCVATSNKTMRIAIDSGLKVVGIDLVEKIDLAVDGADQVNSKKELLKGMGGYAFLKEKQVDYKAKKFIVIIDESKLTKELTEEILVEVEPAKAIEVIKNLSEKFDGEIVHASNKCMPVETDNNNYVISVQLHSPIKNAKELEKKINKIDGVKENGLFTRECTVIVGTDKGTKTI